MLPSASQSHFAMIPSVQRPRSSFKRVSRHKHTFDEGVLIPFYLDDVLPGDTFNVKSAMFGRLATPIFPIMDNMYLETFWFFVPNRLVWTNFVKQHGERTDPDDSVDYTTPYMNNTQLTTIAVGDLWDNFGLPMSNETSLQNVSALPFRMYNMIWNEWFRDQDLQDSITVNKGDGPDNYDTTYTLKRIGKYKDYFTTSRPAPQKGPAVSVPFTGELPVTGTFANSGVVGDDVIGALVPTNYGNLIAENTSGHMAMSAPPGGGGVTSVVMPITGTLAIDEMDGVVATLDDQAELTINALREAITVQQVYELDMRGGTRFIEMIYNHYGVVNPDFRLQRPEFLGYSKSMVNIHPVQQTSATDSGTPQGNLAAFGTVSSRNNGFIKSFTEFGYVIGLVAVRADLTYQNGVDRHWKRQTRFDYYYPAFANLGEQAVLNDEIFHTGDNTYNQGVWGYQEHWAEYRYKTSKVTGLFRSDAAGTLDAWHLAQELTGTPLLNSAFIEENAPVDRTIAVPSEPHFIFDCVVENITARVMPMYSTPGLTRI